MTNIEHAEIFARLAERFVEEGEHAEVRIRGGKNGGAYVKVQTVMNRLDSVLGPSNWWDDYRLIDNMTVECTLTIRLPGGHLLTKRDVGIRKPTAEGEPIDAGASWKAAYSDALKRAASKFGIARYLARCGFASFVGPTLAGQLPDPRPEGERPSASPRPVAPAERSPNSHGNGNGNGKPSGHPRTGRALFAWVKDQEQKYEVGLLKYLNGWAKLQEFPGRMVDWDEDQVAQGYAESCRKMHAIATPRGEVYDEEEALTN